MKTLIIGAGGHGQVVADILLTSLKNNNSTVQPIGYLDDDPTLQQRYFLDIPVLGFVDQISTIEHDAVIVAIGHNPTRQKIYQKLQTNLEEIITAVHPSAIIGADVAIGHGTMICAGVIINPGTRIGMGVILNTGCTVDHHNHIGDHAHIAPGAHLGGDVEIGQGALIGMGATVIPQCQVGDWSVVGAGAVVTKAVTAHSVVAGVPARSIKQNPPTTKN